MWVRHSCHLDIDRRSLAMSFVLFSKTFRGEGSLVEEESSYRHHRPRGCKRKLKGLSYEIFRPVFLPVWIHFGQNVNCFCF